MLKTPDVETIEDFHKYYRNMYVHVEYGNTKVPYLVDGIDGKFVIGRAVVNKLGEVVSYPLTWTDFRDTFGTFGIPSLGMRNWGPAVFFLYRTPERQWSRGYRSNGTLYWSPNEWDLIRAGKSLPVMNDRKLIWEVFNPTYYKWKEAVDSLLEGDRIGCALNGQYALVSLSKCPHPVIVYRRSLIGYWDDCAVLHKLFAEMGPEIQQKWNVPVKIEKEAA